MTDRIKALLSQATALNPEMDIAPSPSAKTQFSGSFVLNGNIIINIYEGEPRRKSSKPPKQNKASK